MTTTETLIRQFEELKSMEDDSITLYASILPDLTDGADREIINGVITDEQKHSRMA